MDLENGQHREVSSSVDCSSGVMDGLATNRTFSRISTDMLLFSEVGMPLTQHYRVYWGGLPHAVFWTDYMDRLRSLLRSPGQSGSPPETGRASTPKSVRRLHRSSQPKRLFPEAGDDGPVLTAQNPAEMVGEMVIDCRPSVLPVSIPLSGLSPDTVSGARRCVSYRLLEKTGQSIMDMDTNEITINQIVGFKWDEAGTDLEDEMPTPVLSTDSDCRPCNSSSRNSGPVRPGRRL